MPGDDPALGIDQNRVGEADARIEAAICSTCRLGWWRALRGLGMSVATGW
jgi:hypothetical protein